MPYIGTSPSNGVRRVHTYTATASQTTFTGASSEGVTLSYADTNYIDVFQNGVLLGSADYTSTSGTSVVLAQGASVNDLIVIVVYDVFSVADTVSKTNGGSFDSGVTMSSTLDVTGASTLTGALSAKGGAVFNEDSADVDFRVESNDNTHAFFVEGSSGDVGIGPSTINKTLHISKSSTSTDGTVYPGLQIENTSAGSGNSYANIVLHGGNATTQFSILADGRSSNSDVYIRTDTSSPIRFLTNGTEAMRMDSSQTVSFHGINGRSTSSTGHLSISEQNDNRSYIETGTTATVNKTLIAFTNGNGTTGSIVVGGTTTQYQTSSDHRLKENITSDWNATTRLKQLNPIRFNFITDADTTVDGFLAHEVQSIVPEATSGTYNELEVWEEGEQLPDGVSIGDNKLDEDGNTIPKYQGIDQSKLVPLLVKTIQELEARITALENAE